MNPSFCFALSLLGGLLAIGLAVGPLPAAAQDDPTAPILLDTLEVIGLTPTHGTGLPLAQTSTNVQVLQGDVLRRLQPLGVTDMLEKGLGSVHLSNLGSNPMQPDVSYRGFRGSPLLGLPQGIAVYQDGARINETFGDIVNWDVIPETAIATIELIPGSNPLFGLNTLGGALSMQTKSGFSHSGATLQGFGGSHQQVNGSGEMGWNREHLGLYAAAEHFQENGWRDRSDSRASTGFAKATWLRPATQLDLSVSLADTRLRGNGAVPVELLAERRSAVFTHPDETENRLGMAVMQGSYRLSRQGTLSGTAYGRLSRTDTFNGDDSDYGRCPNTVDAVGVTDPADALCFGVEDDEAEDEEENDEGEPRQVFGRDGQPVEANAAVLGGTQNTSVTDQHTVGGSLQLTWTRPVGGTGTNRFVAGVNGSSGWVDFRSQTELARLTDDRGTVGSGQFDRESFTEVETRSRTVSVYAVNAVTPIGPLTVTLAASFNRTRVVLDDQRGMALNGDHRFEHLNPSVGASYRFRSEVGVFANWSTSNRAPTPVELTCADPDDPCRLPNGFQADPPLDQVVATTMSAGVRGTVAGVHYAASLFRTEAADDIYFVSAGPARNSGFFTNIGTTRRQGVEVMLRRKAGPVRWFGSYTFLQATFGEEITVPSPHHPLGDEGEVDVAAGSRIPLTPPHQGKIGVDVTVLDGWTLGSTLIAQGERTIRGDEANRLDPLDAFAVVDLQSRYWFAKRWSVFGNVSNLFDAAYATAGLLGEPDEIGAFEDFENPRFVTPGAPRTVRLGIEYAF